MCDLLNIILTIMIQKTESVQFHDFVLVRLRAAKANVCPVSCHEMF
jgi:hypothetical protein